MLLVLGVAVALFWPVNEARKAIHEGRSQEVAITALEKLGCQVGYLNWPHAPPISMAERLRSLLGEYMPIVSYINADHRTTLVDSDLLHLQGMTELTALYLDETQVSDSGIMHLITLNRLHLLSLHGTKVSAAGARELQKALPNCLIYR